MGVRIDQAGWADDLACSDYIKYLGGLYSRNNRYSREYEITIWLQPIDEWNCSHSIELNCRFMMYLKNSRVLSARIVSNQGIN